MFSLAIIFITLIFSHLSIIYRSIFPTKDISIINVEPLLQLSSDPFDHGNDTNIENCQILGTAPTFFGKQ